MDYLTKVDTYEVIGGTLRKVAYEEAIVIASSENKIVEFIFQDTLIRVYPYETIQDLYKHYPLKEEEYDIY